MHPFNNRSIACLPPRQHPSMTAIRSLRLINDRQMYTGPSLILDPRQSTMTTMKMRWRILGERRSPTIETLDKLIQ